MMPISATHLVGHAFAGVLGAVSSGGLGLALAIGAPAAESDATLLHYWDFEADGIVADSGEAPAPNGTLVGGAKVSGGALLLDGSATYVQFNGNLVPTSPSWTVALFARASNGANGTGDRDLISQGNAGGAFFIGLAAGGTAMRAGDNWPAVAAAFIADGEYHHYAMTMSTSESSFYIDGVLVARNAPFAGGAGGGGTRLGRGVGNDAGYFTGAIDEVRIYDDALSEDAIRELAMLRLTPGIRVRPTSRCLSERSPGCALHPSPDTAPCRPA